VSYDKLLPPSQACVSFFRMRFIVRYRRGQDTCVDRGNLANECRYTHILSGLCCPMSTWISQASSQQ